MPRRSPTVRDRWRSQVLKCSLPHSTRLFLSSVLVPHMNASGRVSVPRWRLAEEMAVTERRIAQHLQAAKEAGWLVVEEAGHKGMTAVFRAAFPEPQRVKNPCTLSEVPKGEGNKHPLDADEGSQRVKTVCTPVGTYVPTYGSTQSKRLRLVPSKTDAMRKKGTSKTPFVGRLRRHDATNSDDTTSSLHAFDATPCLSGVRA